MADAPRITAEELKRRMNAGENFTVIDVRNPKAWAEADTVLPGAIRLRWINSINTCRKSQRPSPLSHTAPDQTKDQAPVWRRNFRNTDTRTCGP